MSELELKKETQDYLHASCKNIVPLLEHAREFTGLEEVSAEFTTKAFKADIESLSSALDKEVTRLLIACKPPALDSDIQKLCPKINAGFFQLAKLFTNIPRSAGKSYIDATRYAVCRTLLSIIMLLNSLSSKRVEIDKAIIAELSYTSASGVFWEHCKSLTKIPADNKSAVASSWKTTVGDLIKDAVEELKSSIKEATEASESNNNDGYSSDESIGMFDMEIPKSRIEKAKQILQLATMAKLTSDKVALRCIRDCTDINSEKTVWLDRLLELGKPIQSAVDNLTSTLFIEDDQEWESSYKRETLNLTDSMLDLITVAITFVNDDHLAWFNLCRNRLNETKNAPCVVR